MVGGEGYGDQEEVLPPLLRQSLNHIFCLGTQPGQGAHLMVYRVRVKKMKGMDGTIGHVYT